MPYTIEVRTKSKNRYWFFSKGEEVYFRDLTSRGKVIEFKNSIMEGQPLSFTYVNERDDVDDDDKIQFVRSTDVVSVSIDLGEDRA